MIRILSALALLPLVLVTVWLLPPMATLVLAEVAALIAFFEYRALARRLGASMPPGIVAAAVLGSCAAVGLGSAPVDVILMAAVIAVAAVAVGGARPGPAVLHDVAAALFAPLYLGLPLGALAAVRAQQGREALFLLMFAIVGSDTAQYYVGRVAGRRLLAPAISPKKTVEGAAGGLVASVAIMTLLGGAWLPGLSSGVTALLGATVAVLGIAGDLFESLLKRSADVKDSAALIPGHGGLLDRIDSWLFAAPVYYVFVRFVA